MKFINFLIKSRTPAIIAVPIVAVYALCKPSFRRLLRTSSARHKRLQERMLNLTQRILQQHNIDPRATGERLQWLTRLQDLYLWSFKSGGKVYVVQGYSREVAGAYLGAILPFGTPIAPLNYNDVDMSETIVV